MSNLDWQDRISIDPQVCHRKPCIKGTRIMVSILLDYLKAGEPFDEIRRQYPTVTEEDIRAALAYAAWLAHEGEQQPVPEASFDHYVLTAGGLGGIVEIARHRQDARRRPRWPRLPEELSPRICLFVEVTRHV